MTDDQTAALRRRILRNHRPGRDAMPARFVGGPLEPLRIRMNDQKPGGLWGWALPTDDGLLVPMCRYEGKGVWRFDRVDRAGTRSKRIRP